MNNDLISREALKKALNEMFDTVEVMLFDDIIATIDNAPTVKPNQGEWIGINRDCRGYCDCFKCSICGAYIYPYSVEKELDYNGCPYCFADMRKGGAE